MHGVDHINVDTDTLDTCFRFYRDVFLLELLRPPEDFTGDHAMFEVGDTVVTLVETGREERWDEFEGPYFPDPNGNLLDHDSITE